MRLRDRLLAVAAAAVAVVGSITVLPGAAQAAGPRPAFQLPFDCGTTWTGDSNNSSAHESYEIDFNRGSGSDDLGDNVRASANGTVITSAHQGSANGYGNLVVIDHGGGWRSYYAHLRVRSVSVGASVGRGQKIGEVGNTTRPGSSLSPHLHYEVRTTDSSYPSNIERAYFNGSVFGYTNQTLTSRNGCSGSGNPYTPVEVCGDGYSVIDQKGLTGGTVYLLYNGDNGRNCVTTIKSSNVGEASSVKAYLEVQGKSRVTDSGSFSYYAGPVRAAAENTCVKWGGAVGGSTYDSPFEHCG
ncbi:M23 family metallopeptidase [Actinoplanes sp. NBRC 103695]|uniref:M23 family metallopeptidase n=1 Tax=Actinoplanes sp. NBRC 103695 TaxID=3032202 RepID=UPI0024A231A1|nr:M23 family metallopeptidase [Actinoplanes sp. NBRC 103695]GLY97324.1 peptidase M23 [Actinoplanes sp. NBRC 103695]